MLEVTEAASEDAAGLLIFLSKTAGESNNLISEPSDFDEMTTEQEAAWIRRQHQTPGCLMLVGKVDGQIVATAALATLQRKRISHTSELSIMVARDYWALGVGTALMEVLVNFARESGTLRLLYLGVRADNASAIRLYRRFGFEDAGLYKGYLLAGGEYHDQLLMTLELAKD